MAPGAGAPAGRRPASDAPLEAFAEDPPVAVTFDFWNTLVRADKARTRAARMTAVLDVLARHDLPVDEAAVDAALTEAVRRFDEGWHANRQFSGEQGAAVVAESLGVPPASDAASALVSSYLRAPASCPYELCDGAAAAVEALVDAGVAVGIVCDVGMTPSDILRGYLDDAGLLHRFAHWSFSDEVGVYKPDPVIFRHALDGLGGVAPGRAVHVGDLVRTDITGARAVGMTAVRYAGAHDDSTPASEPGPEGDVSPHAPHAVIHHHDELPRLVGLG